MDLSTHHPVSPIRQSNSRTRAITPLFLLVAGHITHLQLKHAARSVELLTCTQHKLEIMTIWSRVWILQPSTLCRRTRLSPHRSTSRSTSDTHPFWHFRSPQSDPSCCWPYHSLLLAIPLLVTGYSTPRCWLLAIPLLVTGYVTRPPVQVTRYNGYVGRMDRFGTACKGSCRSR